MKCIYCLKDLPDSSFRKTEHVLSQSFGKFKNNFTLNKIVCDACNQYFGDNLEIHLARETIEGMKRFDHNLKKAKEYKSPGKNSRLTIKLAEGPFKGAYAFREYSNVENNIILKPAAQIGFKKSGKSEYDYFLLEDIPENEHLLKTYDLKQKKSIVVLGCVFEEAQKYLAEKEIFFHADGSEYPMTPGADIGCKVEWAINQTIYRGIAKIAFNYFAYWAGSKTVLHEVFNPIRQYVRYGEKAAYPIVITLEKAILGDEPTVGKRRLGHLLTIDWSKNKLSLVAQVSLFNLMTYSVIIAKDFPDKTFCLRKGNFFNVANQEIMELAPGF
ncbi:MAG: hypothetical protein M0T82_03365 [Desulfobacteraceae bacterium]|nr:hypothetical protein [Desulfobacteraceae bacterium]